MNTCESASFGSPSGIPTPREDVERDLASPELRHDTSYTTDTAPSAGSDAPELQPARESSSSTRVLSWESLAQGEQRLFIRHNGQDYQLRLTRNGKLILTK